MFEEQGFQHRGIGGKGERSVSIARGFLSAFVPAFLRIVKMLCHRHQHVGVRGVPQGPQGKDRFGRHLCETGVVPAIVTDRVPGIAISPDRILDMPGRLREREICPGRQDLIGLPAALLAQPDVFGLLAQVLLPIGRNAFGLPAKLQARQHIGKGGDQGGLPRGARIPGINGQTPLGDDDVVRRGRKRFLRGKPPQLKRRCGIFALAQAQLLAHHRLAVLQGR